MLRMGKRKLVKDFLEKKNKKLLKIFIFNGGKQKTEKLQTKKKEFKII